LLENLGKIILASSSSRRLNLLKKLGLKNIEIINHSIDEQSFIDIKNIQKSVKIIAYQKALDVKNKIKRNNKSFTVIAGDTIVYRAGTLFHKASSAEMVRKYLETLSSRKHFVYGGICIISHKGEVFRRLITTEVYFEKLNKSDLTQDILNEGIGKSGGYAIQGLSSKFIKKIKGSYTNVVGISIPEVYKILKVI
jgi:septum formation protein